MKKLNKVIITTLILAFAVLAANKLVPRVTNAFDFGFNHGTCIQTPFGPTGNCES